MSLNLPRLMLALALLLVVVGPVHQSAAQNSDIVFADPMPNGVTFTTLAMAPGNRFRFHIESLRLDRIHVECGQVSGKIFGMEQIAYIEYGNVEVHDWTTGDLIATLSAGESFGPMDDERSYFLAGAKGSKGSVLRFSFHTTPPGDEVPAVTYQSTDCLANTVDTLAAKPADVETLFAKDDVDAQYFNHGDFAVYVGMLTIDPGATVGRRYPDTADVDRYVTGNAVILPLFGGLGNGGLVGPNAYPGQPMQVTGQGIVLENAGPTLMVALLFGVLPSHAPILTTKQSS